MPKHPDAVRATDRDRKRNLVGNGFCPSHPKRKAMAGKTKCEACLWHKKFQRYGLDKATAERLHEKQKGLCPVCREPLGSELLPLHTDHDHELESSSGVIVIRAVVHPRCNHFVGNAEENTDAVAKAVAYAKRWAKFRASCSVPTGVKTWIPILDETARPIEGEPTETAPPAAGETSST